MKYVIHLFDLKSVISQYYNYIGLYAYIAIYSYIAYKILASSKHMPHAANDSVQVQLHCIGHLGASTLKECMLKTLEYKDLIWELAPCKSAKDLGVQGPHLGAKHLERALKTLEYRDLVCTFSAASNKQC